MDSWLTGWTSVLTAVVIVAMLCLRNISKGSGSLSHVPGPRGLPLLGNLLQLDLTTFHKLTSWAERFGSVYKFYLMGKPFLFISNYDAIYETLVTRGEVTAGRPPFFRMWYVFRQMDANVTFDVKWKRLRKVTHQKLKHYGQGVHQLEEILLDVSNDLFGLFGEAAKRDKAMDPRGMLRTFAKKTISVLLCGPRARDNQALLGALEEFEPLASTVMIGHHAGLQLLEICPALIHLPFSGSKLLKETVAKRDKLISVITEACVRTKSDDSFVLMLTKVLLDGDASDGCSGEPIGEYDILVQFSLIMVVGFFSTSASLYKSINLLAHYPEIQTKMSEEIASQVSPGTPVTLADRPSLPYTRAVLYELLRYINVPPLGVPRLTTADTTIADVPLPKGSTLFINLQGLHHDPNLWGDPEHFRPERFLDDEGLLLPPDHPTRKHFMPFSAGVRVCVGEQLAQIRMFLFLTNLIQRFQILPAPGNTPQQIRDDMFNALSFVRPSPYEVFFRRRDSGTVVI